MAIQSALLASTLAITSTFGAEAFEDNAPVRYITMVEVEKDKREGGPLQTTFMLVVLLALCACNGMQPKVRADAEAYVRQHVDADLIVEVLDYAVGEGDADNRSYVVDLRLLSKKALRVADGPFAGLTLEPGIPRQQGLEMLYQFRNDAWSLEGITVSPGK